MLPEEEEELCAETVAENEAVKSRKETQMSCSPATDAGRRTKGGWGFTISIRRTGTVYGSVSTKRNARLKEGLPTHAPTRRCMSERHGLGRGLQRPSPDEKRFPGGYFRSARGAAYFEDH